MNNQKDFLSSSTIVGQSLSLNSVRSSRTAQMFAIVLSAIFVSVAIMLTFVPWVQTATGRGRVTALLPSQRPQTIQAQIKGRLVKWKVTEGDVVSLGDTIAILQDIDSKFLDVQLIVNLEKQLAALEERRARMVEQANVLQRQSSAETNARTAGVTAAEQKLQQAVQKRLAAEENVKQALLDLSIGKQRFDDRKALFEKGLRSQREYERAQLDLQKAEVGYVKAKTDLESARRAENEEASNISLKESEGTSKVLKVISEETKTLEVIASLDNSIAKAVSDVNAALARRDGGIVLAPTDGRVVRLLKLGSGEMVSQGEELAIIAPTPSSLGAEIYVSGNDAPLITVGRKVRMQFDGYPAFQISGWPSVSVGTFGGVVSVVDIVESNESFGKFRIVIQPDVTDDPWPNPENLRLGTQTLGWMQLNTVSLGYELWRQFNGFPVAVEKPKSEKKKDKGTSDEQ